MSAKSLCYPSAWIWCPFASGGLDGPLAVSLVSWAAANKGLRSAHSSAETAPCFALTRATPNRRDRPQVLLRHGQNHARWQAAWEVIGKSETTLAIVGGN